MNASSMKLVLLMAAAALSWALAQSPAPSGVTIRTTTTLVQVGVAAHDTKGQAVEGLKKEDFEILDNGKPQSISVFYEARIAGTAPAPAVIAPGALANRTAAPTVPPAPSGAFTNRLAENPAPGRYSVILLDWSNTGNWNTMRALQSAREMLNRIDPEEQVGLYSFDRDGLKVVNEVGSSRVAMVQSLKTLFGQPSPCFQSTLTIVDEPDSMGDCGGKVMVGQGELVPDPLGREFLTFMVEQRSRATIRAFEAISAHLAGLPGRKSLIWVSAGFPRRLALRGGGFIDYTPQVNRAVRKLNGANTSVYPVDARGLTQVDPRLNSDIDTWSMMDEFAERTGGKSFYGDNGLDVGMQAAIEDVQASYTLGFYAPQDNSRAGFHKLTVRTLRPGVKLRYKEGYYVDEPGKISKDDRKNGVSEALTALMDATSIPIEIKASRQNNAVKLRVSLRPDALALVQKGDRWQGAVEFITRFAKEDGSESAPPVSRRIEFNLTQRTYEAARRGGLLFSRTLEMPAKVASLRVLVRNDPSGEIGTLTIPAKDIAQ